MGETMGFKKLHVSLLIFNMLIFIASYPVLDLVVKKFLKE